MARFNTTTAGTGITAPSTATFAFFFFTQGNTGCYAGCYAASLSGPRH